MDIRRLAQQLRKPEGEDGEHVGKIMASFNAEANTWMVSLMHVQPTDVILEIGFGPGETLAHLSTLARNGFVAGIDHSETMMAVASKKNSDALSTGKMQIHCCDATSLPYEDEYFSKACAANVIYFWTDPQASLREIHRVLRQEGMLVLYMTDHANWLPGIADTGVFTAYTPDDVCKHLEQAGFRDVEILRKTIAEGEAYCLTARK